ncbi:DUF4912 domain-containing protein, partial [Synechococcus sp. CCY 9618]|uniref:DUF4912 domain-containing protein n=1 Tax=Synechococcus sp. CCY 9618 TaxID=2815602 RepID=UPI001C21D496
MTRRPSRFSSFLSQPLRRLGGLVRALGLAGDGNDREATEAEQGSAGSPEEASASAAEAPRQQPEAPAPVASSEQTADPATWVSFLPRDPQWAQVRWAIAPGDRSQALADGATQLCLRVADVTGLGGGFTHPHTLQEVVVESHATEWYMPVPLSGRDYRVELGFRRGGSGGWISLGFSSTAHVPAVDTPFTPVADPFVAFSLQSPDGGLFEPAAARDVHADLHERLYQSATRPLRRLGRGSEAFHEIDS